MYPVSDTANRFYIGSVPDLATEIFHVCINGAVIEIVIVSDNLLHKLLSFYDRFFVLYEISEDEKFRLGNFDLLSTYCKQISSDIQLE